MLARAALEKGRAMTTQENMLARHSILHELGRGATGAVYAARDRTTGAVVALKRLDPALLKADGNSADHVLRQARSARPLKHHNIVQIHEVGEAAGTVYVAMEMLDGENLRNILERGPLPIARAIRIAHEIACGLAHAHLQGVVHEGLKPSNIIVLRSGGAKITDFGIAKLGKAAQLSGAPAGGLSYMAPEQLRGEPVDHRCDIFSLGVVFYEMLTGRRPFGGDTPNAILQNILHAAPRPPSEFNQSVPRALDAIVLSMLAGQPAARMAGVPVLLRELERLEEGLGLGSGAGVGSDEPRASVPPAEPEPALRRPGPNPLRSRAPMQDGPRFAEHGEFPDAARLGIRPDSPAAGEFRRDSRMTDREVREYDRAMMGHGSTPERSTRSRPAIIAALVLMLAVVGGGLTAFMNDWSARNERGIAASLVQQAPTAPEASPPTAPSPEVQATKEAVMPPGAAQAALPRTAGEAKKEQELPGILSASDRTPPTPLAADPGPLAQAETETVIARPAEQPASARPAPAQPLPAVTQPAATDTRQQPGGTARLIVAVSPQGELYIDGKHQGTTPPITMLDLEPGMHRIEVRNGSRKPYLTYMTIEAGDVRRIRHDFDAKPIRPPR
jgi:hypothetical protein